MNCIRSSEIITLGGENYLKVYLNNYHYKVKYNDQEIQMYSLLFKEPNMSDDLSDLKVISGILESLFTFVHTTKPMKILSYMDNDAVRNLFEKSDKEEQASIPNNEIFDKDIVHRTRNFLVSIFSKSYDFEDNGTRFLDLFARMEAYLEKKCFRDHEDGSMPLKHSLKTLDHYKADSLFIKEDLIIEYISFFLEYFPSRSIHLVVKS